MLPSLNKCGTRQRNRIFLKFLLSYYSVSQRELRRIREIGTATSTNPDVVQLLYDTLGEDVTIDILQMHSEEIVKSARVNLLKSSRAQVLEELTTQGIRALASDLLPETIDILYGDTMLGHSLSYLQGKVISQGFGSQLTVHLLDPQPGETILDLAAAPGNKTSFIAERMQNTGTLIANDVNKSRLLSIRDTLTRHGIINTWITNYDGTQFPREQAFDRVLLDAPCTGEGLIVSQPNRRKSREMLDSFVLQRTQQRLVKRAVRLLKPGGTLVYSTCSLNHIENEEVLKPFLHQIKVSDIRASLPINNTPSVEIEGSIRLLPNLMACDGFYIFKGVKL